MKHKNRNVNLKSIAIGNGLTDGLTQYEYYAPMACGEGGYPAVLDQGQCQSMVNSTPRCTGLIKSCYESGSSWVCVPASIYCNNVMIGPYQRTGKNVYDIREDCKGNSLCYDEIEWIGQYLNQDKVRNALGAEVTSYDSCNMDINRNFLMNGDWMLPFHTYVADLLHAGVPVLVYAGDADYICNWLGNKAWTEKYGEFKEAGNFTFLRLFQGGHMIPYDQPLASLGMINRWLAGYSVADKKTESGSRADL
jgi:cathepsin A (carboxypeptidase C)